VPPSLSPSIASPRRLPPRLIRTLDQFCRRPKWRELFRAPQLMCRCSIGPTIVLQLSPTSLGKMRLPCHSVPASLPRSSTVQPVLINEDMDRSRAKLGKSSQMGPHTASYLLVPNFHPAGNEIGVIIGQSTDQEGRFTEPDQRLCHDRLRSELLSIPRALRRGTPVKSCPPRSRCGARVHSFRTFSHERHHAAHCTSCLASPRSFASALEERLFPLIAEE